MDDAQAINNNWSVKIIKCPLSRVSVCLCPMCVNEQQIFIIVDDATKNKRLANKPGDKKGDKNRNLTPGHMQHITEKHIIQLFLRVLRVLNTFYNKKSPEANDLFNYLFI